MYPLLAKPLFYDGKARFRLQVPPAPVGPFENGSSYRVPQLPFLQYFLHTYLVFGPGGDFIKGVISCYAGYSTALFSSAPINYGLVNYLNFNASQAWLGSLIITGVANYFLLRFIKFYKQINNVFKN